jgi:hypothetical protein
MANKARHGFKATANLYEAQALLSIGSPFTFSVRISTDTTFTQTFIMSTITETAIADDIATHDAHKEAVNLRSDNGEQPLIYSGSLDKYEHFDVTPTIGREYPTLSLKELLDSPDSNTLIKDLAIVSK